MLSFRRGLHRGGTTMTGILALTLSGFAIGAVMMAFGGRRVAPDVRRGRWIKFGVYAAIVYTFLAATAAGRVWIESLVAAIVLVGAFELRGATRRMRRGSRAAVWGAYALVGALALFNIWRMTPMAVATLYVVVAVYDGFSQVTGQWFGRWPLAPRISPGKTVEGVAGGLNAAWVAATVLDGFAGASLVGDIVLAVGTGLACLAGDLAASWVKRASGIKDYSRFLPGQGGMLDRFDSFLAAAALIGAFLKS
jgi:phosphatidate cytidylyltransferase